MTIISDAKGLQLAHMLALKYALKLEIKGMKRSGRSAYAIAKEEFELKGSKTSVLSQLEDLIAFNTKQRELDYHAEIATDND